MHASVIPSVIQTGTGTPIFETGPPEETEQKPKSPPKAASELRVQTGDESYPNAKRLGAYWNTRVYRRVIAFERELFNCLQKLVQGKRITLRELSAMLDTEAASIDRLLRLARHLSVADWLDSFAPLHILAKFMFRATYPHYNREDTKKALQAHQYSYKTADLAAPSPSDLYIPALGLDWRLKKPPLYGQWVIMGFGEEILCRARMMARMDNRLLDFSPEYWNNTEWIEEDSPETQKSTKI